MANRREKQLRSEAQSQQYERINVYTCEKCCMHTVTADVAEGVTPFMIGCQNDETPCHGTAYSSFYPKGPKPPHIPEPQFEWYKPDSAELSRQEPNVRDYVEKGGLLLRRRTNAPILPHKVEEQPHERT